MKQYITLSMALTALVLAGCAREESFSEREGMEITIKAVMAENNPTKTVIEDGTTAVLWEPADEVKVFYKTTGSRFTSTNTEPVGAADFTGNLTITGFFSEGFTVDTPLWGLYPYRADATSDGESVTTTLPAQQTGRAGSFAKGTFITLAKSANTTMGFYNVCGGVRFSLTQEDIKEVVFQGQNDEDIAGKVKLAFVDGVPAVQEVTEGHKTITLTAPNGGTFETGKWYYIIALPGTLSGGFKMTFNTETEYAIRKSNKSVTIKRGIFGSLADVDVDLIFIENGGGEPDPDDVIQFKDPIAKYACVDKFDSNHDGEVSYAEAAAVSSIAGLFTDWNTVTSFNELEFFTSITTIGDVFSGLNQLTSVVVPENVTSIASSAFSGCYKLSSVSFKSLSLTTIGNNAFYGCSSLVSISLPSTVSYIGDYAFSNCYRLQSISIPSSVKVIGSYCFQNCSSLSSIELPSSLEEIRQKAFYDCVALVSIDMPTSSLTTIGNNAFESCQSLTSISVPNSVTSLGDGVFRECGALQSASLPNNLTSIPSYTFYKCHKLQQINSLDSVTEIGDYAFFGVMFEINGVSKLEVPSSVTKIGNGALYGVRAVIFHSSSPVTIGSSEFRGNTLLYVLGGMVEMYKYRTNWSTYSDNILDISTYSDKTRPDGTVDMGYSVFWAEKNIGASSPEDYGDHYAWASTEPVGDRWGWSNYFDNPSGDGTTFTKYYNGEGGKTVIELADDIANIVLGEGFRIPTRDEMSDVFSYYSSVSSYWTTRSGINGLEVVSDITGGSFFLPAAGGKDRAGFQDQGTRGRYWSSTLHPNYSSCAWCVWVTSSGPSIKNATATSYYDYRRCDGYTIRPVYEWH